MNPLVTIGIPTYNRADRYLGSVLQSALGQTYSNIEVLVADNNSTDATPEVVSSFSDPRLRYVRHARNIGPLADANFLASEAKGEYLLVHHDDDRIDADFVECCVASAGHRAGVGLIVTGSRVINSAGTVVRESENLAGGLSLEEFILLWYRQRLNLFLCCSLFGTAALRHVGGFRAEFGQFNDVAAEFSCAAVAGRVDVREAKADFREHPDSQTSNAAIKEWCRSSVALLDLACVLAGEKKAEVRSVGLRTSATRNYRYAVQARGSWRRVTRMLTVCRYFGFRQLPGKAHFRALITGSD